MTDPSTGTEYELYDEDDYLDEDGDEEWQQGTCDRCYGGDENGVTATGPLGTVFCACFTGQGADEENCLCGPPSGEEQA